MFDLPACSLCSFFQLFYNGENRIKFARLHHYRRPTPLQTEKIIEVTMENECDAFPPRLALYEVGHSPSPSQAHQPLDLQSKTLRTRSFNPMPTLILPGETVPIPSISKAVVLGPGISQSAPTLQPPSNAASGSSPASGYIATRLGMLHWGKGKEKSQKLWIEGNSKRVSCCQCK